MLIKLLPIQIHEWQDVIKETINKSLKHCNEEVKTMLFKELLLDICQCWIGHQEDKFIGVIITRTNIDPVRGCKSLTILCIYTDGKIPESLFTSGLKTIKKYAKKENCEVIDFYTNNNLILYRLRKEQVAYSTNYIQLSLEEN